MSYQYGLCCHKRTALDCTADLFLVLAEPGKVEERAAELGWTGTADTRACPACSRRATPAHPVLGRALAYAGKRAADRRTTTDAVAHAVLEGTLATGLTLPDSECGKLGYIPLGEWDPAYPHNCPDCAAVLAGGELPELEHEPVLEPVPVPVQILPDPARATPSWRPRRYFGRPVPVGDDQAPMFGAA